MPERLAAAKLKPVGADGLVVLSQLEPESALGPVLPATGLVAPLPLLVVSLQLEPPVALPGLCHLLAHPVGVPPPVRDPWPGMERCQHLARMEAHVELKVAQPFLECPSAVLL